MTKTMLSLGIYLLVVSAGAQASDVPKALNTTKGGCAVDLAGMILKKTPKYTDLKMTGTYRYRPATRGYALFIPVPSLLGGVKWYTANAEDSHGNKFTVQLAARELGRKERTDYNARTGDVMNPNLVGCTLAEREQFVNPIIRQMYSSFVLRNQRGDILCSLSHQQADWSQVYCH